MKTPHLITRRVACTYAQKMRNSVILGLVASSIFACATSTPSTNTAPSVAATTEGECVLSLYQGPILRKKGASPFVPSTAIGIGLEECATICKQDTDCVGFSIRVSDPNNYI
jgi:hypothetical protein